ncbi:hypothetical protein SBDP1_680013 [Syntrophobacter sp. SbD1]|nr:hypothetical protein SBDP1_680013 [Syntrophobacter sp. SbD1]
MLNAGKGCDYAQRCCVLVCKTGSIDTLFAIFIVYEGGRFKGGLPFFPRAGRNT